MEIKDRLLSTDRMITASSEPIEAVDVEEYDILAHLGVIGSYHKKSHWAEKEIRPSENTPTIGVEIEVFEPNMPPKMIQKYFDYLRKNKAANERIKDHIEYYKEKARNTGIPEGFDGIFEFSLLPANSYLTLAREVYFLYMNGLLDPNYKYETHFTLGGIAPDHNAHLLMCAIASCCWNTDRWRIGEIGPYEKGAGGMMLQKNYLQLANSSSGSKFLPKATEFRVFYLQGLFGFVRTAKAFQALGNHLIAYYTGESDTWPQFAEEILKLFDKYNIPKVKYSFTSHEGQHAFTGCRMTGVNGLSLAVEKKPFVIRARKIVTKYTKRGKSLVVCF